MKLAISFTAAAAMALATTTASAAISNPATANFTVSIQILKQCTVTAPSNIVFASAGAYDMVGQTPSMTQAFTVTCSSGTGYTIGFAGTNDLSTGSATHQMKGAASGNTNVVQYNLFDATSGATNTAALSASSSVISGTGTGASQSKSLKAQVTGYTTAVQPDTYTDTVTMSVTY